MGGAEENSSKVTAPLGRRRFIALSGGWITAAFLAACSRQGSSTETTALSADTTTPVETSIAGGGGGDGHIKIGYVTPTTGSLAAFASADTFIVEDIRRFVSGGLRVGGRSYTVEILVEDSESDPIKASERAGKLISEDLVDLMLVGGLAETTNPVSDQCEANRVPCISSLAPWQSWFVGRGGVPGTTEFTWTYHFFWGVEDIAPQFTAMWDALETNKSVGGLFPNDVEGNTWADMTDGFPPVLTTSGYTLTDSGRYENQKTDFTAEITLFKNANAEIITGVMNPADFSTFWKQAKQKGFVPKAASIGKALQFAESIQALGVHGIGLTSEVSWSPNHPYTSSLTGISAMELADAYSAVSGTQWTQTLGFVHSLFEVAIAILVGAGSTDRTAVRDAIKTTNLNTIVGNVDFNSGPIPNVTKTKLCGGQWREASTPTGYDLVIVNNSLNPDVPTSSQVEPITS